MVLDFTCNFGARYTSSGLSDCDIVQSPAEWGAVSGHGNFGNHADGGRDGKLL